MMLTRPASKISTDYIEITLRRVTPTTPHLGLAKAIVGLMVIVRISDVYGYTGGSGRVMNNGTDIKARVVNIE